MHPDSTIALQWPLHGVGGYSVHVSWRRLTCSLVVCSVIKEPQRDQLDYLSGLQHQQATAKRSVAWVH